MAEAVVASKDALIRKLRPKCSPTSVIGGPTGLFDSPGSSIAGEEHEVYASEPEIRTSGSELGKIKEAVRSLAVSSSAGSRHDDKRQETTTTSVTCFKERLGPAGSSGVGGGDDGHGDAEVEDDDDNAGTTAATCPAGEGVSDGGSGSALADDVASGRLSTMPSQLVGGMGEGAHPAIPLSGRQRGKVRGVSAVEDFFSSIERQGGDPLSAGYGGGIAGRGERRRRHSTELVLRPEDEIGEKTPGGEMRSEMKRELMINVPGWTYGRHGFQTLGPGGMDRGRLGGGEAGAAAPAALDVRQLRKTLEMTRTSTAGVGGAQRKEFGLPPRSSAVAAPGSLWIKALEKKAVKHSTTSEVEPSGSKTPEWRDPDPSLWDSYSGHLTGFKVGDRHDGQSQLSREVVGQQQTGAVRCGDPDPKLWEHAEEKEDKRVSRGSFDGFGVFSVESGVDDFSSDRRTSTWSESGGGGGLSSTDLSNGPLRRLQQAAAKALNAAGNARRSCTSGMTVGGSRRPSDARSRLKEKKRSEHPARSRWVSWLEKTGLPSFGRKKDGSSKSPAPPRSFRADMTYWKGQEDASPKGSIITCYTF